jgi:PAS domain S-box-containing protein
MTRKTPEREVRATGGFDAESHALRRRAEAELEQHGRSRSTDAVASHAEGERASENESAARFALVRDLAVHEIELKLQNEQLRSARSDLERSLERYTELFDFAPIGYAVLGARDYIAEVNLMGAQLLGIERRRLVGMRFGRLVAPKDQVQFWALIDGALESDVKQSGELTLEVRQRPGDPSVVMEVRLTATGLRRNENKVLLAFEDITDRKAKAALLEQSERALRESDRRKDEFLAMLSHELRNPLTPIRTSMYLLSRSEGLSDETRNLHAIIERQANHLTRLVNDLLDVTRIRSGKIQLQLERVDLIALIRRALDDHRRNFALHGIVLEGKLPAEPLFVRADAERVAQVLTNLLGNADKFTPRGGTVTVSAEVSGRTAVMRVHDTGAGVAPEVLEHVFEPFAQAPQAIARTRGGLGLGLTMVKGLIELHGGRVAIRSEGVGLGTEVTVELEIDVQAVEPNPIAAAAAGRSLNVCIIEDHKDAAEVMVNLLRAFGHEVHAAYDGLSGLDLVRRVVPDAVLCDIGLPGVDGYEFARAIRASSALQHTYLIALSGYARSEDVARALEAGFDQHVSKPPDIARLNALLADASALRRGLPG